MKGRICLNSSEVNCLRVKCCEEKKLLKTFGNSIMMAVVMPESFAGREITWEFM